MSKEQADKEDKLAQEITYLKQQKKLYVEKKREIREKKEVYQKKIELIQLDIDRLEKKINASTEQFFSVMDAPEQAALLKKKEKLDFLQKELRALEEEERSCKEQLSHYTHLVSLVGKDILGEREQYQDGLEILTTQEEERKRIARELHDSTVQNLTNMVHKTELCMKVLDVDPIRAKLELESMIATVRETIDDMRSIIFNLRPLAIDDLGLSASVKRFVKQLQEKNSGLEILLQIDGEEFEMQSIIKLTIYRMIQEACINVIKHARASYLKIGLHFGNEVILDIIDNGRGFDLRQMQLDTEKQNFGLSILKERTMLLSGTIDIQTSMEKGTQIHIRIPRNVYTNQGENYGENQYHDSR